MTQFNADLTVSLLDSLGTRSSANYSFESTTDLPTLITGLHDFVLALDSVIDAQIVNAKASIIVLPTSGLKTSPNPGAMLNRIGLITFLVDHNTPVHSYSFPSLMNTYFSKDKVVFSGALLTMLDNALTSGGSGPFLTDKYRNPLNVFVRGFLTFHKLRKALSRAT